MTRLQLAAVIGAAVMVFWSVGAYNRLVSLRNLIAQTFAAVDAQLQTRHATLLRWLQAASPPDAPTEAGPSARVHGATATDAATPERIDTSRPPAAETLSAAAQQLQCACDALRSRPGAAGRAVSLRLAEQTLAAAGARFAASVAAGRVAAQGAGAVSAVSAVSGDAADAAARFDALADELAAADTTLGFARARFNDTTSAYNDALRQWPTRLVGWLFGFREAGTL